MLDDPIELPDDPRTSERRIDHQSKALTGEVIDQGEDTEAPAVCQRVHDEVEGPAQVPILRDGHRRPGAQSALAASASVHGEPLLPVQPIELLVIDPDALASQEQSQTTIAEPPAL